MLKLYPHPHRRTSGSSAGRTAALELDASVSDLRSSGIITHVNKVHHVTTITQVAKDLGEDEDWLRDVANEMEIEDTGIAWFAAAPLASLLASCFLIYKPVQERQDWPSF